MRAAKIAFAPDAAAVLKGMFQLRISLQRFRSWSLRIRRYSDVCISRERHETRYIRWQEIDWEAPQIRKVETVPTKAGDRVPKGDGLKKNCEIAANALFGGGERCVVKATEGAGLAMRKAETLALVGDSGCGRTMLAKMLPSLDRPLRVQSYRTTRTFSSDPSKKGTPKPSPPFRRCFGTRSTP